MKAAEVEGQGAPHRRTKEYGSIEAQCGGQGQWGFHGALGRQSVILRPPCAALGRQRFAVERKVVGDNSELGGDPYVVEQVSPLPAVRASGVLAQEADALPSRLIIHAVIYSA